MADNKRSDRLLNTLRDEALAWASVHGLIMAADAAAGTFRHCPVTLLPSEMSKAAYNHAKSLACDFNLMNDRIARDYEFLTATLANTAKADDFVRHMVDILTTVHKEGVAQPMALGLLRSDYMLHTEGDGKDPRPLQVELNTMSAAFGSLTTRTTELHRYLIERFSPPGYDAANLAENKALYNIVACMAAAHKLQLEQTTPSGVAGKPAIMMVVQPNEANSADQRWLEYELWERYQIPLIRRTLTEIVENGTLSEDKQLLIDGHLVTVAYFRAGYTPRDFPSEKQWDAVLLMERSKAVKCPSVSYHLAGTKKVQQVLSLPGVLERFVDAERAARLRTCFAGLWSLEEDDEEVKAVIARAISNPGDFVLKPQREGGGNNLWGEEISKVLSSATVAERSAYILMQMIKPAKHHAVMMRAGEVIEGTAASELGIFAGIISDGKTVYLNQFNGHLLRTKLEGVNEGGVASGYAVLDSPYLL